MHLYMRKYLSLQLNIYMDAASTFLISPSSDRRPIIRIEKQSTHIGVHVEQSLASLKIPTEA